MSGPLLAPGTYFVEEQSRAPIPTQAETIVGMLGFAERGPVGVSTRCVDFDDWQRQFGGYTAENLKTAGAVKQFFDNGGRDLRFVRIVHYTDPTNPLSKTSAAATKVLSTAAIAASAASVLCSEVAPYNMEPGQTLAIDRDASGAATATFSATAAAVTAGGSATYALSDGMTLTVKVDGGAAQEIDFLTAEFVDIANATTAEVNAVINAKIVGAKADANGGKPRITSDLRGTGSGIEVTGGTANAALSFSTTPVAGTGNVANIDAVTSAEVKTVVEAAVTGVTVTNESGKQRISSNTTGVPSMVQVQASSTADTVLGFDNAVHNGAAAGTLSALTITAPDGSFANEVTPIVSAPTNGQAGAFNLTFQRNGVTIEAWANLTMDEASSRFVEKIINDPDVGSIFRAAANDTTIDAVGVTLAVPASGSFGTMSGGDDGLAGYSENDVIGGTGVNGSTGLRVLDAVVPHVVTAPGLGTPAIQNAVITWCLTTMDGKVFPILDTSTDMSSAAVETYYVTTAGLHELSEFGAFYWPYVSVANPNRDLYGDTATVDVPPSGTLAGLCARVDGLTVGGAFDQPAGAKGDARTGYTLANVLGVSTDEVDKKSVRDRLSPLGINIIRKSSTGTYFVDGSSTLKSTGSWPSVGQRRGIIFVERQLEAGLEFAGHRNITTDLLRDEKAAVDEFMIAIVAGGNLASRDPTKAYFADFGPSLNKATTRRAKQTRGRLGIASAEPNVFTVVQIGPDTREIDAELAAATSTTG